ncbi:GNAT family N-acetyltransferase [Weissella viridescens]|uniref:GNAT family N-acetyltransferase n=1 Tax=Weissella viridescens TaxID=1629 RepID=A0A3P2RE03_WEIVI|nr:GNAT family N-acetyltransferase [Weissella viridescens]RRG17615.1 GNAT family N-acetyltransferase [Weissella viridescens]
MGQITFRRFAAADAPAVVQLVAKTMRISNRVDYSETYIENALTRLDESHYLELDQRSHFYVVCDQNKLIGTGAIGPFWDIPDEYSFFAIFVDPAFQGQGIGTRIVNTLEADPFFAQAQRIEIPASITGRPFYEKFGYQIKHHQAEPDAEGLYRLEKFHTPDQ